MSSEQEKEKTNQKSSDIGAPVFPPREPTQPDATLPIQSESGSASTHFPKTADFDFEIENVWWNQRVPSDANSEMPILGEYVIESPLGAGGMGQVFKARHRTMDRCVALKILPAALADNPDLVDRFYSEIRAVSQLMHPNIVTAFDAGCQSSVHFLVMELIEGDSLSSLVAKNGPMTAEQVVEVVSQAASALDYAHSKGIIHRDIKPSNMMLTQSGVLKILDFGLARFNAHAQEIEKDKKRQLMGTVEYMSPEQINQPDTIDHRSDLYSLGATIFFLLTGRPMFHGEKVQTAMAQVRLKPPALYEVRGDIDIRLDSVFQRLVKKDRNERYNSGGELISSMISMNLISPKPLQSKSDRSAGSRLPPFTRENPTDGFTAESTSLKKYAGVGIDLGMRETRACFIDPNRRVRDVLVDDGGRVLRNIVWSEGQGVRVGKAAAEKRVNYPSQIFHSIQRWFGLPLLERPFGGRQTPPEVIVAALLRQVVQSAKHQGHNASHCVINVPASYDQLHRMSVATACRIAGVEVLQLLDRHLAAGLALLHHPTTTKPLSPELPRKEDVSRILVCTLTGSACEAAVADFDGQVLSTVAAAGDWKQGVSKWQHRLTEVLVERFQRAFKRDIKSDPFLTSRIVRCAEQALDMLRTKSTVEIPFDSSSAKIAYTLSEETLLQLGGSLIDDLPNYVREALDRANATPESIDVVLLIGEFLRLESFRDPLRAILGDKTRFVAMNQGSIARGAAIQTQYLMPPGNLDLVHAEPTSNYELGFILEDGERTRNSPKILIDKDHPLPFQLSKTLRFAKPERGQPNLQFIEGTRMGNSTWNKLGRVSLAQAFPDRPPEDPLQLLLEVDASGLWKGCLVWLAQNRPFAIPKLNDPAMDEVSLRQWRDWLETLMLCNVDHLR